MRQAVPWWVRIWIKVVLSRLPIPYGFWKKLRLFEHGDMNNPQRAWDNFVGHAGGAGMLDVMTATPQFKRVGENFSVLELGPGDSLFSAIISQSLGASDCWLVDAGAFADTDMSAYAELLSFLRGKGMHLSIDSEFKEIADILHMCNAKYLTNGVKSLAAIPSNSVDFCFSNAVLEHIPRSDFSLMVEELRRIMKPVSVCIHRVDLKDHLGGGLNNLRFSEKRWESPLFRNSGFYTNRIRFGEMMDVFKDQGFECALPRLVRWKQLPLDRKKLDVAFRQLPEDDLLVSGFDVVLRCAE